MSFVLRNVLLGTALLGAVGGVVGSFTLLRRQSLLGDALAHAALPGVCVAFLLAGGRAPAAILAGAFAAGLLGALAVLAIVRTSRIKEDAAIGIVLSVFFGAGVVLLTYIQDLPLAGKSGLDRYLFGQAATIGPRDVARMAAVGGIAVAAVLLFYKEFKVLVFDRDFAKAIGLPVTLLDVVLTAVVVLVIVMGLEAVGVVLVVAALVTPAAAARQWTDRLGTMLALAAGFGAASGVAGALASAAVPRLPTGPSVVLVASGLLAVSILFAPRRGVVAAYLRERAVRARIRRENLLKDLYRHGEAAGFETPVPASYLAGSRGGAVARELAAFEAARLVEERNGDYLLTKAGRRAAAEVVRKHRLWETFLARRLDLPADHLHRDADAMEHALTAEDLAALDERLGHPTHDPHGRAIPRGDEG